MSRIEIIRESDREVVYELAGGRRLSIARTRSVLLVSEWSFPDAGGRHRLVKTISIPLDAGGVSAAVAAYCLDRGQARAERRKARREAEREARRDDRPRRGRADR